MAITERDETYVLDLTVLLKALREARQEAAQVAQQLQERLQACRDLDARAATTLTQAVQRATASLLQQQESAITRVSGEVGRYQAGLTQQLQQLVDQAARVRWWLPWKVGLLVLGATLLVNAAGTLWWGAQQAEDRKDLRTHKQLAVGLNTYLAATLYPQLSKAQQHELETIYKAAGFAPIGPRRR